MPINFHAEQNRLTYASREADSSWVDFVTELVDPAGKTVVDVGCGGGIYTKAWARLGCARVIGVDSSKVMLEAARETCAGLDNVTFHHGDALATGLDRACADVVFARALVHHVQNRRACVEEFRRLLGPGGLCIIQDRTPEDVTLPGSAEHIRGFFFERFPRLMAVEAGRRPSREELVTLLQEAGFARVTVRTVWEVRRTYGSMDELAADLANRTGRSILHELSDDELQELIQFIREKVPSRGTIVEKDRWTVWLGETEATAANGTVA